MRAGAFSSNLNLIRLLTNSGGKLEFNECERRSPHHFKDREGDARRRRRGVTVLHAPGNHCPRPGAAACMIYSLLTIILKASCSAKTWMKKRTFCTREYSSMGCKLKLRLPDNFVHQFEKVHVAALLAGRSVQYNVYLHTLEHNIICTYTALSTIAWENATILRGIILIFNQF